ncbi:DUF724 domain-containing protein 2-like [Rutidosis leptorrhynchoides]|uniref:DUF724 domain-containing protein 2-like n=1 Tax=Rutidosis leptorrhynchoides TaxID=125765 RepID=UPI003A991210
MADDDNSEIFTVGSKVEVSSNEPGFEGAWYVATLLDTNIQNSKNKKGCLVKCDKLCVDDDLSVNYTEVVDPKFIRPLPPPEYGGDGVFQVGDVIDADSRDGWWIGVVVKKVMNENDDDDDIEKYVVRFENDDEESEFKKDQLRFHVDWVDSTWKRPKKAKMADTIGAQASESNNDAQSGFITPSKGHGKLDNTSSYSTTRRTRSQTRPECSNSRNRNVNSNSRGQRSRFSARVANLGSGNKTSKKLTLPVMEMSGSRAVNQDSPLAEHEMITTETSEEDDRTSQQSARQLKLSVNRNESQQGSSCSTPGVHREESSGQLNQTGVVNNGVTTTDNYQQEWAFIKQSSWWATLESHESYQNTPQKPHFTPLKERKQFIREGLAIGLMVAFSDMVHRVSSLQLIDPINMIKDCLEILDEFESHGFDVGPVRDCLNTLLTWKVRVGQLEEELENEKSKQEKFKLCKSATEEDSRQIEAKIRELQEILVQNLRTISVQNEKINESKVRADSVCNQMVDYRTAFAKLAATPLANLKRLPVRHEVDKRGNDLESTICPICKNDIERWNKV